MTTQHMTARCELFGDWGSPAACWRGWDAGGAVWGEHLERCRACRATEAERRKRGIA